MAAAALSRAPLQPARGRGRVRGAARGGFFLGPGAVCAAVGAAGGQVGAAPGAAGGPRWQRRHNALVRLRALLHGGAPRALPKRRRQRQHRDLQGLRGRGHHPQNAGAGLRVPEPHVGAWNDYRARHRGLPGRRGNAVPGQRARRGPVSGAALPAALGHRRRLRRGGVPARLFLPGRDARVEGPAGARGGGGGAAAGAREEGARRGAGGGGRGGKGGGGRGRGGGRAAAG